MEIDTRYGMFALTYIGAAMKHRKALTCVRIRCTNSSYHSSLLRQGPAQRESQPFKNVSLANPTY